TAVEWSVTGPGCSGPTCGSMDGDVYFAPTTEPTPPIVRLTATSKADSRASDSTIVCLVVQSGRFKWMPPLSAAASISAAARQAAQNNFAAHGSNGLEVTTDTQGVDFGPYLQRVMHDIKQNWYKLIPQSAQPPLLKRGKVVIKFAIANNGQLGELQYVSSSG